MAQKFYPGQIVPEGGIYRINHDPAQDSQNADTPDEVTVIKRRRSPDHRSPEALAYRRWYSTPAW